MTAAPRHLTPRERAAQAAAQAAVARARQRAGLDPPPPTAEHYPPGYDPYTWPPTGPAWRARCRQIRTQTQETRNA